MKEEKFIVPGWMVSFSDMIVNLMCFFILLNTMAMTQESGFVGAGTGSYADDVNAQGKPGMMPTHRTLVPLQAKGGRHEAPKIDPLDKSNWTQHTKAKIEDEFDRLHNSKSKIDEPKRSFPVGLGILFSSGSADLSAKDKADLEKLATTISQKPEVLEVVGACSPDECRDQRAALLLSFERAQAVVEHLKRAGMAPEKMIPIGVGLNAADAVADQTPRISRRVAFRWQLAK